MWKKGVCGGACWRNGCDYCQACGTFVNGFGTLGRLKLWQITKILTPIWPVIKTYLQNRERIAFYCRKLRAFSAPRYHYRPTTVLALAARTRGGVARGDDPSGKEAASASAGTCTIPTSLRNHELFTRGILEVVGGNPGGGGSTAPDRDLDVPAVRICIHRLYEDQDAKADDQDNQFWATVYPSATSSSGSGSSPKSTADERVARARSQIHAQAAEKWNFRRGRGHQKGSVILHLSQRGGDVLIADWEALGGAGAGAADALLQTIRSATTFQLRHTAVASCLCG